MLYWFVNNKACYFTKNCCSWLSVWPSYYVCFLVLDTKWEFPSACGRTSLARWVSYKAQCPSMFWVVGDEKGLWWGYWNTCPINPSSGVYQALSCASGLCGMHQKHSEVHVLYAPSYYPHSIFLQASHAYVLHELLGSCTVAPICVPWLQVWK